jgi:hypothetical protein
MSRLSARSPTTRVSSPARTLATGQSVRGRRLRRRRRVLLAQRELALETGDPLGLLCEFLAQPFIFAAQSLDLLDLLLTGITKPLDSSRSLRVLRLHRPERTKFLRNVQVQNACQASWGLNCYRRSPRCRPRPPRSRSRSRTRWAAGGCAFSIVADTLMVAPGRGTASRNAEA